MAYDVKLLSIDYLIFSSHKSGTQTLRKTLNNNGFVCEHCHGVGNLGIPPGAFCEFLDDYANTNQKPLCALSVFREPMERHASSFFQWYGSAPLRLDERLSQEDTFIAKYSVDHLLSRFLSELDNETLVGYEDSLNEICWELKSCPEDLLSKGTRSFRIYNTPNLKLYVYRFDQLFHNAIEHLSNTVGKNLRIHTSNTAREKWYSDKYNTFKEKLNVPRRIIRKTYSTRRDIINSLYEEGFDAVLDRAYERYSFCS